MSVCSGVHSEMKEGGVERERERAVELQYKKKHREVGGAERERERGEEVQSER